MISLMAELLVLLIMYFWYEATRYHIMIHYYGLYIQLILDSHTLKTLILKTLHTTLDTHALHLVSRNGYMIYVIIDEIV